MTARPLVRIGQNLLMSVAPAALLLGALEGVCRVMESRHPPRKVAEYLWNWEERWDGDFYTVGSDAVGWPPWQEFNADGLRDRARPIEKLAGTRRVIALGDSVTMGAGIEASEAWPQVLEERYEKEGRPVDVMNVALWGWSTRQERIAYGRLGRQHHPDQVLLAVCLNDIPELQNNLSRPPPWLGALFARSALVRRLVNAEGREIHDVEQLFREADSPTVREAFGRFFEEVRALRRDVEADGATLAVVVFPFRFQVAAGAPLPTPQQAIAAFCKTEGIPCLDLLPKLRTAGESAFVDYDHPSPLGARLSADAVAESGVVSPTEPWPAPPAGNALAGLRDEEPRHRVVAARTLAARGKGAASAVPALFEALGDPSENVRWAAAQALWKIEPPADVALAPLVAALPNPDPYVRGFAAWTLGNFGEAAKDAVPALIETVRAEEKEGRGAAILALARIGPSARAAAPALIEALRSPRGPRRADAARALGRIGAPEAVPALMAALKDDSDHVRVRAARALGKLGPAAAPAVDALAVATKDESNRVRHQAAVALKRIRGLEVPPDAAHTDAEAERE